jgi:hypothetical protein
MPESTNYFEELEKIANDSIDLGEMDGPSMNEDHSPSVSPEEAEVIQAANSEPPSSETTEDLRPASPDETEELEVALAEAEQGLNQAQETLANVEDEYRKFEKTALHIERTFPAMGALAQLLDYSTNDRIEEPLQKLAQERLTSALQSEEEFVEVLAKTASELFQTDEAWNTLFSNEGVDYVLDKLSSFEEDEELSKIALEAGGIISNVKTKAMNYVDATRDFLKLRKELSAANTEVQKLHNEVLNTTANLAAARRAEVPDPKLIDSLNDKDYEAGKAYTQAALDKDFLDTQVRRGGTVWGAGGAALGAGGIYGGKKLYDKLHPDEEEALSERVASDNINGNYKQGGINEMSNSIVVDFLKVAGAAALLDVANNEQLDQNLRKEAADTFNAISRMGRRDMDESFVKVATQLYSEPQLHEIVAGYHTAELFDKVAFFTNANDMSADELEKVAGAEGVAAKGVAGALTDAQENIVATIEKDKKTAETDTKQGNPVASHDDMTRYHVIQNPGEYKVEKSASLQEAMLQKEAAWQAYVEAENFLRTNGY